jgi:hypothetical protein
MRGWGRRRDSSLRQELQQCQSRIRLALDALAVFRQGFMDLALHLPMLNAAELLARLDRIEIILGREEGGGR